MAASATCCQGLIPTGYCPPTRSLSFVCFFTHTFSDISDVEKSFERTLLPVDDPNFCHTRIVTKEETSHSKRWCSSYVEISKLTAGEKKILTFHWSPEKSPPKMDVVWRIGVHLAIQRCGLLLWHAGYGSSGWNAAATRCICKKKEN